MGSSVALINQSSTQIESKPISVQDVSGQTISGVEGSTINLLDAGAIQRAADITVRALQAQLESGKEALNFARTALSSSTEQATAAREQAFQFAAGANAPEAANTKLIILAGMAIAGLAVGLFILKG